MLTPTGVTAANYRNAILNGYAVHARLVFPVQNITLTDDDITSNGGIRLNMLMNPDIDLVMGKAVMSEVTVELINSNTFNGFDWTEEFRIDFGVDINGSTNWVTVGYFKGKKPEKTVRTQTITFIAYDRMQRFDVIADDFIDSLNSSETVSTLYTKLCTYIGISKSSTNSIANAMNASVSKSNLPKGITCRTLLAWIAEVNCCYAKIKANGNVDLVWFTNQTTYTLTEDDYFGDSNIDEDPVSVPTYVRVASTDDNATGYIYPLNQSGEKYTILDNPIMLNMAVANRESVITTMLSRFSAVGAYIPAMISAVGCWLFETGDIITVVYDTNKTMSMPVFNRSLYYNGGCSDAYECTGNAARTEMTESVREQYKQGGKLAGKYSIVSGVDIDDDGVSISGNKYIKLLAGASIEMMTNGVFVLKSSNLDVDSVNGYLSVKKQIDGKTHYLSFGATRGSSSGSISADVNVGKNKNGYYTEISSYDDGATASGRNIYSQLFLGMGSYRDKNKNADVVKPVIRGKCASYEGSEQNVSEYGDVLFTNGYFEKSVFAEAYLSESLGSIGNISELQLALNNLLSRNDFNNKNLAFFFINFKATTTFGPFYADVRYYGIMFEGVNTSVAKVDFYDMAGSRFVGYRANGTWQLYREHLGNGTIVTERIANTVAGSVYTAYQVRFKNNDGSVNFNVAPIRFIGTDAQNANNGGIILGSNTGTTIVNAGENGTNFPSKNSIYNDESLYLIADGSVYVYPGITSNGSVRGQYAFPIVDYNVDLSKGMNLDMPKTKISANSELNDLKTPGTYYIESSADAATIGHCPWSGCGGRIDVMKIYGSGTNYIRQIGYQGGNSVNIFVRTTGNNGDFDLPWYQLNLTQV